MNDILVPVQQLITKLQNRLEDEECKRKTTEECLAYILDNNKHLNLPLGMTIRKSI